MKLVKLAIYSFLIIPMVILSGCKDREITNPFDAACPKEIFTPTDFKAEQAGNAVKLSWKQENTQISGFIINRNENDGTIAEVVRIDKSFSQWSDENIGTDKKYGYQLVAYAGENLSNMLVAYCTPINKTVVVTDAVSGITSTSAVFGGSVTNDSGLTITGRGVCYSTNVNPTTADSKVEMGSGSGAFNLSITGLKAGNTYYVRAYATTKQGTSYGSQVTFSTSFLTVTPIIYNAPKEAGNKPFTIASNIDWQVTCDQTWCTLSANSGKGNGTITVTFTENKEVPQRTATITFTGSGVTSQSITLTQAGTEPAALSIAPDNQNVTNTAGTTTFNITSNVSWTVTSDQPWCTITNTTGTRNTTLTVTYEANTTNSQRIANLSVTGLGLSAKTVTITQQPHIPIDGLAAYYPFNGNANDESGNGNNGTVYGATLTTDRKGIAGKAYSFSGISNYINVPTNNQLSYLTSTWCFWIKTNITSSLQGQCFLSRADATGSFHGLTFFEYDGYLNLSIKNVNPDIVTYKIDAKISDNNYHLICFVFTSGNSYKIYIDSALKSFGTLFQFNFNNQPLRIGNSVDSYWNALTGSIDDIRIYNRALTEAEIQQLYNE